MGKAPEERLVDALKESRIEYVATLPCDKLKNLLPLIPRYFNEIPLTREANGFGICAGLVLAGRRPAILMQNTGLGNAVTDIASLFQFYQLPLPVLMSWRGHYEEAMIVQNVLGGKTPRLLEALGVPCTIVEKAEDLDLVSAAIDDAYRCQTVHAVLLSPSVWEGSSLNPGLEEVRWLAGEDLRPRGRSFHFERGPTHVQHTRYEATKLIVEAAEEQILIGNTGIPSKELFAAGDRPLNFYMLGSLGLATSIGVGLSLGQQREVWVLDGDGSLLMNPNALFSASMFGRSNLTVFAIDNAAWGSTGDQVTPTLDRLDLELLARCCGIANTHKVHSRQELHEALQVRDEGPRFIHFLAKPGNVGAPNIPLGPLQIRDRFLAALRGERPHATAIMP